jgi:hypothetical protein
VVVERGDVRHRGHASRVPGRRQKKSEGRGYRFDAGLEKEEGRREG